MNKSKVSKILGIVFEVLGILSPFVAAYFEQEEQEKDIEEQVRRILAEEKEKENGTRVSELPR